MHDIQISNIKLHLHWYLIWKFPFDRMLNQFNANCSGKMYLLLIEFFGLTHLNREPACSNKIEGFSLSKQQIAFEKSKKWWNRLKAITFSDENWKILSVFIKIMKMQKIKFNFHASLAWKGLVLIQMVFLSSSYLQGYYIPVRAFYDLKMCWPRKQNYYNSCVIMID